jgi:hypothetical protein
MVCDSLCHDKAVVYPSYSSLRKNFLMRISGGMGGFFGYTLMCIYPMRRVRPEDEKMDIFSQKLIDLTLDNIKNREIAVTDWKDVCRALDSIKRTST